MGTNHYALYAIEDLATPDTEAAVEVRHLGKLSVGWLPTIPYEDVDRWFMDVMDASILRDEYGRVYTAEELIGKFVIHARRRENIRRSGETEVPFISFDCVGEGEFS